MPMSMPENDAELTDEFQEMLRVAGRDARVTGIKYSLQRVRSGTLALLAAAVVCGVSAIFALGSAFLQAVTLRTGSDLSIFSVVFYAAAAGSFLILFWLAMRNPQLYSVVALVLFGVLCIPSGLIIGSSGAVWLVEFLVLIALIDAVRVARQHAVIVRRTLMAQDIDPRSQVESGTERNQIQGFAKDVER